MGEQPAILFQLVFAVLILVVVGYGVGVLCVPAIVGMEIMS